MTDFSPIALEMIRAQSRYVQAERKFQEALADLKAATDDLWEKAEIVMDAGYEMSNPLPKRPGPPTPSKPHGHWPAA